MKPAQDLCALITFAPKDLVQLQKMGFKCDMMQNEKLMLNSKEGLICNKRVIGLVSKERNRKQPHFF